MTWENQKTEVKEQEKPKIKFKLLKEAKENRGLKVLSYGNFSTGKTHFALSSPKPVYIIDTENGASPLADKFPDANIINISNIDNDNVEENDEVKNYENYIDIINYLCSLPDNEVKTIIIDSISDVWEWCQAYGKIKVFKISSEYRLKQQWDWATIFKLYLTPLKKLINKNCDLIIIAREGEIYEGVGKPSGRFEPKCMKKTPYWVDVVLYHEMKFINKQLQFQTKIIKCRHNEKAIGKIIINPTLEKIKQTINEK